MQPHHGHTLPPRVEAGRIAAPSASSATLCGSNSDRGRRVRVGGRGRALPAEFAEPLVIDAEVVGDLVDDGTANLVSDLLLGAADRADRLAVNADVVGQDTGVLGSAAGERDALVQPEQAGGPAPCSTVTATLRISWPSSSGSPSSAVLTISSKRPGSTSITSPLSCLALPLPRSVWRGSPDSHRAASGSCGCTRQTRTVHTTWPYAWGARYGFPMERRDLNNHVQSCRYARPYVKGRELVTRRVKHSALKIVMCRPTINLRAITTPVEGVGQAGSTFPPRQGRSDSTG